MDDGEGGARAQNAHGGEGSVLKAIPPIAFKLPASQRHSDLKRRKLDGKTHCDKNVMVGTYLALQGFLAFFNHLD